jgi:protein TonB
MTSQNQTKAALVTVSLFFSVFLLLFTTDAIAMRYKTEITVSVQQDTISRVFNINEVSVKPKFGRRKDSFEYWVYSNIKYPEISAKNGVTGTVIVKFVVSEKGKVEDAMVVKGVNYELDKEAMRVISKSPDWKSGLLNGKPVRVRISFPVVFQLK